MTQYSFNIGPTSATLVQHWTNVLWSTSFVIPAVIQSVCLQPSDQVGAREKGFELLTHRCRSNIYEVDVA